MSNAQALLLGIDTGGTFTDLVAFDGRELRVAKVPSTPDSPEQAILQGIEALGLDRPADNIVHGSTVATNALLEGKGARTAYITNHGLADMLTIGRQARTELYELQPRPHDPPVARELCLETGGRLSAQGVLLTPLDEAELERLRAELARLQPQAVAINLLYSFLDDRYERAIEAIVPEGMLCSRSSRVLPEYREYERGIATWLNSYVGPIMAGYLGRLQAKLSPARVRVMQSHGGTLAAGQARAQAVQLLLSGPAGGLMGGRYAARASGFDRLLTFDMGGTSTDVALIDGDIGLTSEGRVAGYPVAVPMVDLHTIGAGGGSIARLDPGGLLQVGPQSAGAQPGPACYGQGGKAATVTDANLVLGRLPGRVVLGGGMRPDREAAGATMSALADQLGMSLQAASEGVIRLANEHMTQALRVISVQRGLDPADYTLVSFGGAGGLHVCDLARSLGMVRALVPFHAGVLSALGMLVAPQGRQLSLTLQAPLGDCADESIAGHFEQLAEQGRAQLRAEGVHTFQETYSLELRYTGQSSTLAVPLGDTRTVEADFHAKHQQQYGHRLEIPVELVNLRVGLHAEGEPFALPKPSAKVPAKPLDSVNIAGLEESAAVYRRDDLMVGQVLRGPALVMESEATILIITGWGCEVDEAGNLLLEWLC